MGDKKILTKRVIQAESMEEHEERMKSLGQQTELEKQLEVDAALVRAEKAGKRDEAKMKEMRDGANGPEGRGGMSR